jgi:hypothetical protein
MNWLKARLQWLLNWLHDNRTKVAGYTGVALGAAQAAQGQGWRTFALGVAVALIGHYNDWTQRAGPA